MIPKIIHLCWLSNDEYPEKIKRCLESWKRYMPDYEIMLWNTTSFDINSSKWVHEAYDTKKYAFAADYIRFYALYNYGGIYLDSDVEIIKNFNDIIELPYFIGAEKAGTIEAAIIGAQKGEEWIKKCLDYYENKHFINRDGSLDIRKLPEIMEIELSKFKNINYITECNLSTIKKMNFNNEIVVLPNDFFSPKLFDSRRIYITPNTYAIHHYENSWFSKKAKIYYRTRTILINIFGYKNIRKIENFFFDKQ